MASNLRKKMIQKDIEKYSEFQINDWWDVKVGLGIFNYYNSSKQRYSKEKMRVSFENPNLAQGKIPYYQVNNEIYNMIPCPSGSFMKGHQNQRDVTGKETNPFEEMRIEKSFFLGETEITQELYESVMGKNPSHFENSPKNPVEKVSWYDAIRFCNKLSDLSGLHPYYVLGKARKIEDGWGDIETHYPIKMNEDSKGFRLPTEWEWEYAMKAGTQLKHSGSDDVNEVGWYNGNSNETTHPVKQKKPNSWGFYDMSGNVAEWCENKYGLSYSHAYGNLPTMRAVRDGHWDSGENFAPTFRSGNSPITLANYIGFRVCKYV